MSDLPKTDAENDATVEGDPSDPAMKVRLPLPKEVGGPAGPEPTRFGDWEQKGRCTDF